MRKVEERVGLVHGLPSDNDSGGGVDKSSIHVEQELKGRETNGGRGGKEVSSGEEGDRWAEESKGGEGTNSRRLDGDRSSRHS